MSRNWDLIRSILMQDRDVLADCANNRAFHETCGILNQAGWTHFPSMDDGKGFTKYLGVDDPANITWSGHEALDLMRHYDRFARAMDMLEEKQVYPTSEILLDLLAELTLKDMES